jgi:hypothetical protein
MTTVSIACTLFITLFCITVEDTLIFRHLFELSNGKIDLKESNEDLSDSASLMRSKKKYSNSNTKKSYKKSTSNTNRGHKRY